MAVKQMLSLVIFVLMSQATLGVAQQTSSTTPPPTTMLQVFTRRVSVDVVVTDAKGKPVTGLTRDDFKVLEDGVPQPLRSFDAHVLVHDAAPKTDVALDLPPHTYANLVRAPEDGPVTVILYDVLNTPAQVMPYAHEAMVKFIKNQPPGSRTAIFVLGTKLRMLEGFTDDATRLLTAINSKAAGTQQSSLLLNAATSGNTPPDLTADNPQVPVDPTATGPTSILGELTNMEQLEEVMQYRQRLDATVDAFAEIARFLAALPGRKNLLWLSGSFPGSILPNPDSAVSGTSSEFGLTMNGDNELRVANDLLESAHVAVYPVDVRGLQTDSFYNASNNVKVSANSPPKSNFSNQQNAEHSTMDVIAEATGGHAFYNTNGLGQAMQQAIEQGSVYYTLTYSPTNAKYDGSMRKIHVELDKAGYQLAYRKSYFSDDPSHPAKAVANAVATASAAEDSITKSMQHGAPISTELFFETTVLPVEGVMQASPKEVAQLSQFAAPAKKGASDKPLMVQHYEVSFFILGRLLSMPPIANGKFGLNLTFAVAAFDADGLLENGLEITVKDPINAAEHDRIKASAYRTKLDVALPLDARWVRIAVRDSAASHTGTIEVPITGKP